MKTRYFYTDADGQKHGPISKQKLRSLAILGTIVPDTPIETNTGIEILAAQIPSLWNASLAKEDDEANESLGFGWWLTIIITLIVCVVVIAVALPLIFVVPFAAYLFLVFMEKIFKIESHLRSIREHYENE